jgi:hypothetical protein
MATSGMICDGGSVKMRCSLPVLSIPPDDDNAASATHRAAVFLWVLVPWVVIFYAVQALGRQAGAFGTMLAVREWMDVLQWTELGYVSTYLFIR